MTLEKVEVIDFESRHKIIFSFSQSRNPLLYKKSASTTQKVLNKYNNIKVKGNVYRQHKLTDWL